MEEQPGRRARPNEEEEEKKYKRLQLHKVVNVSNKLTGYRYTE